MQDSTLQTLDKNSATYQTAQSFLSSVLIKNESLKDILNQDREVIEAIMIISAEHITVLFEEFGSNLDVWYSTYHFLKILELVVAHFKDLTPKVTAILLAQDFRSIFLQYVINDHLGLYLTVLEKIQSQGYTKDTEQLLMVPTQQPSTIDDNFIIAIVALKNENNAIRLFKLLENQIKKPDYDTDITQIFGHDIYTFLTKLHLTFSNLPESKEVFMAYMRFLEQMYSITRHKSVLGYLLQGFRKHYGSGFTLSSSELAYELACSSDTSIRGHLSCFPQENLFAQQLAILKYIKNLPDEKREQAHDYATTAGYSLYKFFHLHPNEKINFKIKQLGLFIFIIEETQRFLNKQTHSAETCRKLLNSIRQLNDSDDIIEALSKVDTFGKNIAFYLESSDLENYFKLIIFLLDGQTCPIKIGNLLAIQENLDGDTIGHRELHSETDIFLETLKRLPNKQRIQLMSIKNHDGNLVFPRPGREGSCHAYIQLLYFSVPSYSDATAKEVVDILTVRNKAGASLLQRYPSLSNYHPFLHMLTTLVSIPQCTNQVTPLLYQKTDHGLSYSLSLNNITPMLCDLFKNLMHAFTNQLVTSGLANFLDNLPHKFPLLDFLHCHFLLVDQLNTTETYVAYIKFLETIYPLISSASDKQAIVRQALNCLISINSAQGLFGKKYTLDSAMIYRHQLEKILDKRASDYDDVEDFLGSLLKSNLDPNSIIDILGTTSDENYHLGIYLATHVNKEKEKKGMVSIVQDNHIVTYFKLLHYLFSKKNADPQKITQLLLARVFDWTGRLIHFLDDDASMSLLLDLTEKLPIDCRLQLFSSNSHDSTLLSFFVTSHQIKSCRDNLFRCLTVLCTDLLNNPDIAEQMLNILSFEKLALRICSNTNLKDQSLLILQILHIIVARLPQLMPHVVKIFLVQDAENKLVFGHNFISTRNWNYDDHVGLYLTILEKIQGQGYTEQIDQILSMFPFPGPDSSGIEDIFILKAMSVMNDDNRLKMIGLYKAHIKNTHFAVATNFIVRSNLEKFLLALKTTIRLYRDDYLAYVDLLETMYLTSPEKIILDYLLHGCYVQAVNFAKYTLNSWQLAYDLACMTDSLASSNYWNYFRSSHQESVLRHIDELPEDQKLTAVENIKTTNHSLNQFFNYDKDKKIQDQISQRYFLREALEKQIKEFLDQEKKDVNAILQFLEDLAKSNFNPNTVIEALALVDDNGKHISFYVPNESIDIYFSLLITLLAKGGSQFKITSLLSLQENNDGQTIGHSLLGHRSFINLINRLSLDCQLQLLSIKANNGCLLLMAPRRNGFDYQTIETYLKMLHTALASNPKDPEIAKIILDIFSGRDNLGNNLGLKFSSEIGFSRCLSLYLKILDLIVTYHRNNLSLIHDVIEILAYNNEQAMGYNILNLKLSDHIYQLANIIWKTGALGDTLEKLLVTFNNPQKSPAHPYSFLTVFATQQTPTNTATMINIFISQILATDGNVCASSPQAPTFQFHFFSQLFSALKTRYETEIHQAYLKLIDTLYRNYLTTELSFLMAYEFQDKQVSNNFQGYMREFATEQKKQTILAYIRELPKEQRIATCRHAFEFGHSLYKFFTYGNDKIMQEVGALLANDSPKDTSQFATTNFLAPVRDNRNANFDQRLNQADSSSFLEL